MIRSFFDPIIHFENLYFKAKYENILEDSSSSVGKKLRFFVNMCILIGVFSLIFSTVENLHQKYASYFFFFDFIVSSVFLLEYWYRFQRAERKLKFFFHPQRIIELFSFAPFFLGILFVPLMGLDILKLLRLFSVFRLFSFSTQSPLVKGFLKSLSEYKDEYGGVFGVFASILIIFSTLVYYAEHMHNPDFSSIPQALWWGIVTMATV